MSPSPVRIRVIGSPGSGKTTIAQAIARTTGIPHLSLDDIRGPLKALPSPQQRRERQRTELFEFLGAHEQWVIDGNQFDWARESVDRADYGIVVSHSLPIRAWRCFRRWQRELRYPSHDSLWNQLAMQTYVALWDWKWLSPLLVDCDSLGLPVTLCRSENDVRRVLTWFPGALAQYQAHVAASLEKDAPPVPGMQRRRSE